MTRARLPTFLLPAAAATAALLTLAPAAVADQDGKAAATAASARSQSGELVATPVRGSVHMLVMPSAGNVGVSVGPDGAFLIDDQFAPMAPKIAQAVKVLSDGPIRYILNTHWHGDHTGGNEAFGDDGVVIVAHDNVRKRLTEEQFSRFFGVSVPPAPPAALPVITFSHQMKFHFNGDTIHVVHLPNAHTDGDSVFYFEKADVFHAGDLFVLYGYPFIDLEAGGSVAGMIAAAAQIIDHIGPQTLVIPGHGPLSDRTGVQRFHDMLVGVRERIAQHMNEGRSLDDIVAARPLAAYDAEWGNGFVGTDRFIELVYRSEQAPAPKRTGGHGRH